MEYGKYLDKPPQVEMNKGFEYPTFKYPKKIWDKIVIGYKDDYTPEAVFITQIQLPHPLPSVEIFLFGFKLPIEVIIFDDDTNDIDGWIGFYCIKVQYPNKWEDIFLQQYSDEECDTVLYRQYESQVCEYPNYDDIKEKGKYNLSGKKIYWGQHPCPLWPKSSKDLLYLISQVKEGLSLNSSAYPGGARYLLFSGLVSGKLEFAIYRIN